MWVVTGDGDALSIGGNHLIHALRRNVNLKILLFNNRIYGLTKGQYSPTSELGKITKSTPMGSLDAPFNPVSLALGAEATFVARTIDSDRKHLTVGAARGRRAPGHRAGRDLPELQHLQRRRVRAAQGPGDAATTSPSGSSTASRSASAPTASTASSATATRRSRWSTSPTSTPAELVVHDAHADDPSHAFALSRLAELVAGPHPDRRLPRRRAAGLRRPDARPAGRGRARPRAPATWPTLLAGSDTWTVD